MSEQGEGCLDSLLWGFFALIAPLLCIVFFIMLWID
jgi:hypothetical protein